MNARNNSLRYKMADACQEGKYAEKMLFSWMENVLRLSPMFIVKLINTIVLDRRNASSKTMIDWKKNAHSHSHIVQYFLNVSAHLISSKLREIASNARKTFNGIAKQENANVCHLYTKQQMENVFTVQLMPNSTKNNKNVFACLDTSRGDHYVEDKQFVDDYWIIYK